MEGEQGCITQARERFQGMQGKESTEEIIKVEGGHK